LVLQAGSDRIVDPHAPHAWLERVGSPDKTLRVLPDHYHELLNELDWANTLADLLDWLELRILQAAAGAALGTAALNTAATIPLRETA
jgi:lysophospholipase